MITNEKHLNKLKNHRCYVCGPIDRAPDSGYGWRKEITPLLQNLGIIVFDPLLKPTDIGLEADDNRSTRKIIKQKESFEEFSAIMRSIRHADLRMVDVCDFMIAYIDLEIFACGTIEEMVVCNKQKKPVLIVCKQGKSYCPDWIFGMIPHQMIFSNIDELMSYIKHVDNGEETDSLGRWIFFKY